MVTNHQFDLQVPRMKYNRLILTFFFSLYQKAFEKEFANFKLKLSDDKEPFVMTPSATNIPTYQPPLSATNPGLPGDSVSFKNINIEIVQGDITKETSDAIVYSTDKDFSFGN